MEFGVRDSSSASCVACRHAHKGQEYWKESHIGTFLIQSPLGHLILISVTPSGETGQWGPRPSHCSRWHWTVTAHLSSVRFRVVLGFPFGQLDWLSYVPIRGLPLELRCPVAMTSIPLLVISGNFYLRYYTVWDWFWLNWDCLMFSVLDYCTDWDCLLVSVLSTILVWDCLPHRVLYWFRTGSVSSRECPAIVFKKLRK